MSPKGTNEQLLWKRQGNNVCLQLFYTSLLIHSAERGTTKERESSEHDANVSSRLEKRSQAELHDLTQRLAQLTMTPIHADSWLILVTQKTEILETNETLKKHAADNGRWQGRYIQSAKLPRHRQGSATELGLSIQPLSSPARPYARPQTASQRRGPLPAGKRKAWLSPGHSP